MKKILLILVSSLFLSSLALSESKLDNALEKCADTQIFLGKNIPKFFFENHEVYKIMTKDRAIFKKNYDEYSKIFMNTYEKYRKDNPRVQSPKYEELRKMHVTGNFPKDHKCSKSCDMKKLYQYLK